MSQCKVCGGEHSEPWEMGRAAEEYAARMTADDGERLSLGIAFLMGVAEFAAHNPAYQPSAGSRRDGRTMSTRVEEYISYTAACSECRWSEEFGTTWQTSAAAKRKAKDAALYHEHDPLYHPAVGTDAP